MAHALDGGERPAALKADSAGQFLARYVRKPGTAAARGPYVLQPDAPITTRRLVRRRDAGCLRRAFVSGDLKLTREEYASSTSASASVDAPAPATVPSSPVST
jgi:hypothetical protein